MPVWNNCGAATLDYYAQHLDKLLQNVNVPFDALFCCAHDSTYLSAINKFYEDTFACISTAISAVIPSQDCHHSDFNVPGWNTYVKEKHEAAREAFLVWLDVDKPRFGPYFENMKRTRALFKLALRYCKNHIEELKADACAESLLDNDSRKFWNNVYKISNNKTASHVNSVGGSTGPKDVADMWKRHFEQLYSSAIGTKYKEVFENKLLECPMLNNTQLLTVDDVIEAISKQKHNKAPGPDGIHMEAFIYGGRRLNLYLSILFNLCLSYGYVPDAFHHATIIPLVKCKTGDLTDVNNYRAIALSNSVSKILETLLFSFVESQHIADEYQFGFKKNHSTALCTDVFKKTVDYFRKNGSHVFSCFIDFNKAFDNVDYWLLFCKLLDSNASVPCRLATRLLAYWYSNQIMCVSWQNTESAYFRIANGVRQGGILSPYLFRFYIRDLIDRVRQSNIGCIYKGIAINLLAYADDMVLLAPSWRALQSLLHIVQDAAVAIKMSFNTKKTVCMIFNPCNKRKTVCDSFPAFSLAGCNLLVVQQFKYLGHIIDNSCSDDADINRELKSLFTRTNVLIRRFKRCSTQVKVQLFRSFCICFYDAALWCHFTVASMNKLASSYTKCMKIFFNFDKYSSVTSMLLQLGLPSFTTLLHNYRISFVHNLSQCDNLLVKCLSVA